MVTAYRIYLDVCCLNRPFDHQGQPRIRLETEALLEILNRCQKKEWQLISSIIIESEIAKIPDPKRKEQLLKSLVISSGRILMTPDIIQQAKTLENLGIKTFDALHVACAEGNADIFLTTDDRLIAKANNLDKQLQIRVANPITWLLEVTTDFMEEL